MRDAVLQKEMNGEGCEETAAMDSRTAQQTKEHYELETQLASKLRSATMEGKAF